MIHLPLCFQLIILLTLLHFKTLSGSQESADT
jgi:hypothetical protein